MTSSVKSKKLIKNKKKLARSDNGVTGGITNQNQWKQETIETAEKQTCYKYTSIVIDCCQTLQYYSYWGNAFQFSKGNYVSNYKGGKKL